jgi:hypothetical protein
MIANKDGDRSGIRFQRLIVGARDLTATAERSDEAREQKKQSV